MWRSLAHEPYRFKISKNNISSMDSFSTNASFPRYKTYTIVSISDFCKNVKFLLIFCLFAVQRPLLFMHIAQVTVSFLTFIQVFAQMQVSGPTLPFLARLKDEDHVSMRESR